MLVGYGPRTYRGDPGILGSLWRFGKGVVTNTIRTGNPVTGLIGGVAGAVSRGRGPMRPAPSAIAFPGGARMGPRGSTIGKPGLPAKLSGERRSRRMNIANPKALRRAIRRQAGFVKLAKKALKGSGYTVVSKGSTRKRYNVREAGPGGVTIQN